MLGNDRSTAVIVSDFRNFYSPNRKIDEKRKNGIAKSEKPCYNNSKQQLSKGIKTKPRKAWSSI